MSFAPLAERMRPVTLEDYAGQAHLLAANKPLRRAIAESRPHSMLFWSPPGTGKTTLARLLTHELNNAARQDAQQPASLDVPLHLRNAPTKPMQALDYGKDYRYAHHEVNAYVTGENYFPEGLQGRRYYYPVERGLELKIREKLATLRGEIA